jgi:hypothetical protein
MAHFIVDLDLIYQLEISLRRKLKPDEILIVSYIKSFPKGYYGSKTKLANSFNIPKTNFYRIINYFLEKKILIKEKEKFLFAFNADNSQYGTR